MGIGQSFLLGIVEGATEFLPVSSTGHLILAQALLGIASSDFVKTYTIVIQVGAILAVVVLYFKKFFNWPLLKRLVVAFIPTGVIGLLLYPVEKSFLLQSDTTMLIALFVGGIGLIAFEKYHGELPGAKGLEALTYKDAVLIGLAQSVAIIPGVSRSGATVLGGLARGLSRAAIVEFSFLLAVPTMVAASGLSLYKSAFGFSAGEWLIISVGFVVSFLTALMVIRWFLSYVRGHTFTGFGWYRIALSILFALWLFL